METAISLMMGEAPPDEPVSAKVIVSLLATAMNSTVLVIPAFVPADLSVPEYVSTVLPFAATLPQ